MSQVGKTEFFLLAVGSTLGLGISINIFFNPSPFPSSFWDVRWVGGYGLAFFVIVLTYLAKYTKWLFYTALVLLVSLLIIPVFTLGLLKTYLALSVIFLVAWGGGIWLLERVLGPRHVFTLENLILAPLLGSGVLMVLRSIQGALQAFSTPWTWLGLIGLVLVFVLPQVKIWLGQARAIEFWKLWKDWSSEEKRAFTGALVIAGILLWGASWMIALAPPTRYDELTYHVAGPSYYLRQGGIVPYPEGGNNPWLHYVEILYSLGLEVGGETAPRLMHLSMAVVSSGLIFLLGRKLIGERAGLVAAILFFSLPVVGYEGATAYIDLFITAYAAAAAYALVCWYLESYNNRWLVIFGILAGLALGMKLTAAPVVAVLSLALIGVGVIRRRRLGLRMVALVFGIMLLLSAPWFVRDWLWTGDPFFPYGQWLWAKIFPSLSLPSAVGPSPSVGSLGESILRVLRYPFDLVFNGRRYYHEAPGGMVVALPFLATPVFLFSERLSKRTRKVLAVALGMSALAVGIMFFANNALLRYALPIFPWLALAAGANFELLLQAFESSPKVKHGQVLGLLLVLVYLLSTRPPFMVRIWENLPQRLPINYFLGRESREAYLSRTLPVYDAYRFIDAQPGGRHRVLSVGNEFRLYAQARIDGVYDVAEAQNLLVSAQSEANLAERLKEYGYDFILINQPEVEYVSWKYTYPILQQSDFLNHYAELVFARRGIYVYQLRPEGVNLPSPYNLLNNAGFEEINAENPASWGREGTILLSNDALEGERAVLLYGPLSSNGYGYLWQQVPVEEGKIYTVGYWLRAYSDQSALFLMRVVWLNQSGQIIGEELFWKNVEPEWTWYYFYTSAPREAAFARVYASAGGDQGVLVDAVCMAEGQRCPLLFK
jgi:hypothetical protein